VEIDRIERVIQRHPRFITRVFTPTEQAYCQTKLRPSVHLALRFAAKEALLKATGTGFRGVKWTDIEVQRDDLGKPSVVLSNSAQKMANEKGISHFQISLSFDHQNAVAVVVAESGK
jgi:holo-[acyl-carrier protein] synthase